MSHVKPTGSFVALVTPMNTDGSIDYEGFRTLIRWQEEHGTRAVLIMGSTGEVSMLTQEERRRIISETSKMKSAGMQVWHGCTGNSTASTIEQVKFARSEGSDGAILAAPAYICADAPAIEAYMFQVLDSCDLAMGFYNNPPRVSTDLGWEPILRLSRHPNMTVLKESTTRVGQVGKVCEARPDMSIMCCCSPNLGLVVPTMTLGGHGTANMTGNIVPGAMRKISKPWETGEDAFAFREAYLETLPMLHFAYSAINPVAIKTLMRVVGLPSGPLRKPLRPIDGPALQAGIDAFLGLGLGKLYGLSVSTDRLAS